jgi:hypothetical protein
VLWQLAGTRLLGVRAREAITAAAEQEGLTLVRADPRIQAYDVEVLDPLA